MPSVSEISPPCRDSSVAQRDTLAPTMDGSTQDAVLALRGLGKELWADEGADNYVQRQREDWI